MKKVLITLLVLTLVLGCFVFSNGKGVVNKVISELIDDYRTLSNDSDSQSIMNDDIVVQVKLDIEDFTEITTIDVTNQDEYRKEAKRYYSNLNNQYLSTINLKNYKSIYVSNYAPYIEFNYQRDKYYDYKNTIEYTINNNEYIEMAYVKENMSLNTEHLKDATYSAGAYDQYLDNVYTGSGIKVGVLEPGLVDADAVCFTEGQVITNNQGDSSATTTEHATLMAGLIAGYDGIAHDATVYSTCLLGSPTEEFDWFLEEGVNIVNMSYGDANPDGVYASDSAYCDYIVNTYKITLVAAVGNFGQSTGYVGNPALGYNVIGVGSCNYGGYPDNFSSYLEVTGPAKPNIMALGYCIALFSLNECESGTSISCAVVTGILTLLMEKYPVLKTCPELVLSLISCSAYLPSNAIVLTNGFSEICGAGMLRYDSFIEQFNSFIYLMNLNGRTNTFIYSKTVDLTEGTNFKTSIAWTAYANGTVSATRFTNYDLYLFDSEGNEVASATSTNSNIELIRYTVPADGVYTIKIKQIGAIKKINEEIYLVNGKMPEYLGHRNS